jgi:hypothetical protein
MKIDMKRKLKIERRISSQKKNITLITFFFNYRALCVLLLHISSAICVDVESSKVNVNSTESSEAVKVRS